MSVEGIEIKMAKGGQVVIADDGGQVGLPEQQIGALVGVCAVADQIAQKQRGVELAGGFENGFQGLEVGVDVTQDEVAHLPVSCEREWMGPGGFRDLQNRCEAALIAVSGGFDSHALPPIARIITP